jgi:hypothetical protein
MHNSYYVLHPSQNKYTFHLWISQTFTNLTKSKVHDRFLNYHKFKIETLNDFK